MKNLKKTAAAIGKMVAVVLARNLPTGKDLATQVYPRPAYAW